MSVMASTVSIKTFVFTLSILSTLSNAKMFLPCEFVHQLYKHGTPGWQIPTMTCIAVWESGLNSSKINVEYGRHGELFIFIKIYLLSHIIINYWLCSKILSVFDFLLAI